ncbi:MAG: serine/threonine protein kinase [Deltaproteobacteria bacterium]|nr:serine/threonine protein kinase [Deltaproteobacteria bacterium]
MDGSEKSNGPSTHTAYILGLSDHLRELKCIAKGGMAQIYRAHQPSLDRYVVVKQLRQEHSHDPETIERFRREARALASVLHQNVAHVYDFVESEGESYILMEYIDGLDLSTVIEKVGHLPPLIAAAIMLNACKGMAYIHTHNIIHRDIKPSNIRLTTRGEVKLMDFGIVVKAENEALTRPGIMVGSPCYLSPEQVLGDAITPKADIFLLGICFYEMLTGTRPFSNDAGATVFQKIREAHYIPVRQMQSQVPKALSRMVERCLQKEPSKRYSDAKVLIADLENYLGPLRSSHTEDLILKFLDEEALLKSTVSYSEIDGKEKSIKNLPLRTLLVLLLIAGLSFLGGYQLALRGTAATSVVGPSVTKTVGK